MFQSCCFNLHKSAAFLRMEASGCLRGARHSQPMALGMQEGAGLCPAVPVQLQGHAGLVALCVESSGKL